jgi:3-hydroxyisobutyrate dehydrogenase-like beta-hydroxyacid dehydrogenase
MLGRGRILAQGRGDVRLALERAGELHVPAPSARAADEVLTRAGELGYEHRDIAGIFEVLAKMDGAAAETSAGRG